MAKKCAKFTYSLKTKGAGVKTFPTKAKLLKAKKTLGGTVTKKCR